MTQTVPKGFVRAYLRASTSEQDASRALAAIDSFAEERGLNICNGTVAKLAMRQPFVLFKGLTFQKLCLPGAFRPGDHH
ncbi:hypothetical protein OYC39_24590, partial [Escherichia coli]|nr:hypothetical protein [Escherichia coli]